MKRFLLLAALSACMSAAWAQTPAPVTSLTHGGTYYIYDAFGDDGTNDEQTLGDNCRYCFRYDSPAGICGTHIKPANASSSLEKKHVWVAEKEGDSWTFRNVETKKWLYLDHNTNSTNANSCTLVDASEPGSFYVVATFNTSVYWDGSEADQCRFVWYPATDNKHPIKFYAAETTDNGATYSIGANIWPAEAYPFQISADKNSVKWQAWFMHSSHNTRDKRYTVTYTPAVTPNVQGLRNPHINEAYSDTELWAFVTVGKNRVKIYNKYSGLTYALKNDGQNGASIVPEAEATVWEIAPSTSNGDTAKYFCLKVNGMNQYANMQFVNNVGRLKNWPEADHGSTAWVEKKFQPVVDYYSSESTYDLSRPAMQGCVGDFSSDDAAETAAMYAAEARKLAASVDPDNVTDNQLANLAKMLLKVTGNEYRIRFYESSAYRLYNEQYSTYMKLDSNGNLVGGGTAEDDNAVTFTPTGAPNKYYMSMGRDGNRFFGNVASGQQTGTSADQVAYTVSTIGRPYSYIFQGADADKGFLHQETNTHKIVGWDRGDTASHWLLVPANETTNLEPVTNVDADRVVYDLQGRRVANPTAGIYIINGRKVLVK